MDAVEAAELLEEAVRSYMAFASDADHTGGTISFHLKDLERNTAFSEVRSQVSSLIEAGLLVQHGHMLKLSPAMHMRLLTDDRGLKRSRDDELAVASSPPATVRTSQLANTEVRARKPLFVARRRPPVALRYCKAQGLALLDRWILEPVEDGGDTARVVAAGKVYNHQGFTDGVDTVTSALTRADGRIIHTSSGSTYFLGDVQVDFRSKLLQLAHRTDLDETRPLQGVALFTPMVPPEVSLPEVPGPLPSAPHAPPLQDSVVAVLRSKPPVASPTALPLSQQMMLAADDAAASVEAGKAAAPLVTQAAPAALAAIPVALAAPPATALAAAPAVAQPAVAPAVAQPAALAAAPAVSAIATRVSEAQEALGRCQMLARERLCGVVWPLEVSTTNNVETGPSDLDRYLMPPPPPRALSRVLAPPPETGCSAQAPLDPSFGLQNDKSVAESALSSDDTVMVPSDLVTDESMTMLRGDVAHGDGEQEASTPAPAPSHVAPLTTTSIEQAVDGPTPMVCEAETHAEGVPDQSSTPRSTPASPAAPPSPPRAPPPPPSLPPLVGDGHAMAPAAEPTVAEATTSIDAPLGAPSPSTSHMHLFKPVDIGEAACFSNLHSPASGAGC